MWASSDMIFLFFFFNLILAGGRDVWLFLGLTNHLLMAAHARP